MQLLTISAEMPNMVLSQKHWIVLYLLPDHYATGDRSEPVYRIVKPIRTPSGTSILHNRVLLYRVLCTRLERDSPRLSISRRQDLKCTLIKSNAHPSP